ncbi:ABC transporter permease [Nakamurella endophytica]|uniref:ABC transporter permease n=1 Tax=Nakamurella endophytica TaxID=1748367 RepID=A0A917WE85_9ACTN|nr:ABC transporter permease [Nakamurella endophytica]GGL94868.1 ABC transporter permease [Nakamurella endophytica]
MATTQDVGADRRAGPPAPAAPRARRSRFDALLLIPALLLILGVVGYPFVVSVIDSFVKVEGRQHAYAWITANPVYLRIIGRTFLTSVVAVVLCVLLAYPYAYVMVLAGRRIRLVLTVAVLVPFWVSGLVRTFAWVILLQSGGPVDRLLPFLGRDGLLHTQTAVLVGLVQVLLPFMILPLYNSMQSIDRRLLQAAESLGARQTVAFFRVVVPLSAPGAGAGALLVFVTSLGIYVLAQILGSPATSMIGSVVYTQTSQLNNTGRAAALSLSMLAGAVVLIGAAYLLFRLVPGARRAG